MWCRYVSGTLVGAVSGISDILCAATGCCIHASSSPRIRAICARILSVRYAPAETPAQKNLEKLAVMASDGLNFKEVESIKNFEYPVACTGVCIAPNQRRILTTGIYNPSARIFDLSSMSMKFERHLAADPLKIVSLTGDGEKFAVLRNDRCIEFHSRNGHHDQVSMPCQPKEILFNPILSELYASGDYGSVYRFNLEQGRFLREIEAPGMRSMAISAKHGLVVGASEHSVRFVDTRTRESVLAREETAEELLCVDINENGLNYLVGDASGLLREYDMRSDGCVYQKKFESHVGKAKYNGDSIFCAVRNDIQVSLREKSWIEIGMGFLINDFDISGGLLVAGGEYEDMRCYFSSEFGPTPSWCTGAILD